MSAISRDDVAHLAGLSRLALTEAEVDEYAAQLEKILEHVAAVGDVATDDVPAMSHPTPIVNVHRSDERVESLTPDAALDQAPNREGDRFRVPQILGEE